MDEPTNDLDIETLELLEEQLLNYQGTLLLISHDREFFDNVVTSTFVLEGDGEIRQYPGGYDDYLRQRGARPTEKKIEPARPQAPKIASKKLSYNEKRELEVLPDRIDALEKEIAEIESELAAGRIYTSDRLVPAQAELEAAVDRWATLAERAS